MSLKAELETWAAALAAYDAGEYEKSLDMFSRIADSSKILTNMGLIYATIGEHELAVEQFIGATSLDTYLAVAYFQCGVSNFLLGRFDLAFKDFDDTMLYLRGNNDINYEQLGLKFKLFAAEVLFNKGLSQINLNEVQAGLQDMEEARRWKATDEHNVIDDAIQDRGEGYTVFSIPVGVLYRPPASKLKNVKAKDYLGKAKLIAAADAKDAFTTFTGVTRLQQGLVPSGEAFADPGAASAAGASLKRNATEPPPRVPTGGNLDSRAPGAGLARAQTTLNVPANRAERLGGGPSRGGSPTTTTGPSAARSPPTVGGPSVARANTTGAPRSPGFGSGAPSSAAASATRGLSIRKGPPPPMQRTEDERELAGRIDRLALADDRGAYTPQPSPPANAGAGRMGPGGAPPQGGSGSNKGPRVTEFYDDYLDSYTDDAPPEVPRLPTGQSGDRVAAWARGNADPRAQPPMSRSQSTRAPPSAYAPSSFGGSAAVRRKPTRRGTVRGGSSRAPSAYGYEEEEEGYGSGGEYDEVMYELTKIRVKLHFEDDVRGMALTPEMPFEEVVSKIAAKFGRSPRAIGLKFRDEDGGKVTLRDESDYELAIETARESAKGRPEGKLEIWVTDI